MKLALALSITKAGADVRVGMQLDTSGRTVHVKALADGGLAATSGLREGDVVQDVDGVHVDNHAQGAKLISAAEGEVVINILRTRAG